MSHPIHPRIISCDLSESNDGGTQSRTGKEASSGVRSLRVANPVIESLEGRRLMSGSAVLTAIWRPVVETGWVTAAVSGPVKAASPGSAEKTGELASRGADSIVELPSATLLVPTAVIETPFGTSLMAQSGLHVNAVSSTVRVGTPLTAKYAWDFGDPKGRFNTYEGFNAAHVYTTAGTYTVRLTVTDETGRSASTSRVVSVTADTRKKVFVSRSGSDANDGSSESRAVATPQRALQVAGSNVTVLLRRGDMWDMTGAMSVSGSNVVVGAYGSGNAPVLRRASSTLGELIAVQSTARDVSVQDLAFDSNTPTDREKNGAARGVKVIGTNVVVRNCLFTNVSDAVNGEQSPRGVLLQDNVAPTDTSVRSYFSWVQGSDWVFLGNTAPNSTREHIVRVGGADRINAQFNTFANKDLTTAGDTRDIAKGIFTLQVGSYMFVANNDMKWGPVGVGPLGGVDGAKTPSASTSMVVYKSNVLYGASANVSPGARDVLFVDNVITSNGGSVFNVTPTDLTRDSAGALIYPLRNLSNITFDQNTGVNNQKNGRFMTLQRASAPGAIRMTSNLYSAPILETGYNQNAPVYVGASDLASFSKISGNVWPVPTKTPSGGGVMYVWPSWWDSRGYVSQSTWTSSSPVSGDVFGRVSIADSSVTAASLVGTSQAGQNYSATVNNATAGSRLVRR